MFEERYKEAMNKQEPTQKAVADTHAAMEREISAQTQIKAKTASGKLMNAIAAACLALVFAVSAVIGVLHVNKPLNTAVSGAELHSFNSYDEIAQAIKTGLKLGRPANTDSIEEDRAVSNELQGDKSSPDGAPDYSDTNNQVVGVNEADVVKTDGRFIYILDRSFGNLKIVKADEGKTELISSVDVEKPQIEGQLEYFNPVEMYLFGDRLTVIARCSDVVAKKYTDIFDIADGMYIYDIYDYFDVYSQQTCVINYDITDRSAPKLISSSTQSGRYVDSRAIDGNVYVISSYSLPVRRLYGEDGETDFSFPDGECVPKINGAELEPQNIYAGKDADSTTYTVITASDITGGGLMGNYLAFLGRTNVIYASQGNIYLSKTVYNANEKELQQILSEALAKIGVQYDPNSYEEPKFDEDTDFSKIDFGIESYCLYYTDIVKIGLDGGNVSAEACARIPGMAVNQFNFDESAGYLRVATVSSIYDLNAAEEMIKQTNSLFFGSSSGINVTENRVYVLDEELGVTGVSEAVGLNENIKSVRYIGDIAYVVTFRQTDPLYAIDLSDPAKPTVLSELKMPGFSTYMQQYGNGLLLGIGWSADDNGATDGIKISMYDVSDPYDVKIIDDLIYKTDNVHMTTSASYNHKALLIDKSRSVIAMPFYCFDWDGNESMKVIFFGFEDGKLFEKHVSDLDINSWDRSLQTLRVMFIGDYYYIASNDGVVSLSAEGYEMTDKIEF